MPCVLLADPVHFPSSPEVSTIMKLMFVLILLLFLYTFMNIIHHTFCVSLYAFVLLLLALCTQPHHSSAARAVHCTAPKGANHRPL